MHLNSLFSILSPFERSGLSTFDFRLFSLPFTGEGLGPIGLPVAVRRTLPGLGSPLPFCRSYTGEGL